MSRMIIAMIGVLFLGIYGIVQSVRVESFKKQLIETKVSLYDCRATSSQNELILSRLAEENERIKTNLNHVAAKNMAAKLNTDHQIAKVITAPVAQDCEKAMKWGAEESSKIAEKFTSQ